MDKEKVAVFECWSGTKHIMKYGSCETVAQDLESLLERIGTGARVGLIVIDPPYGLNKADWDTPELAEKFCGVIIPQILKDLTSPDADLGDLFTESYRFLIFNQQDNPALKVLFSGYC